MKFSNTKQLPFICPINNKKFNTFKGLGIYVTKTLKYEQKYYYDNILLGDNINCYFCNNIGNFISITKGYRNLCSNPECISKSRSTSSVDGLMYKYNCTKEEAQLKLKKLLKNNSDINKKISQENTLKNSNYLKENSSQCVEFYLKKGYNLQESIELLKNKQIQNVNKLKNKLLTDDIFKHNHLKKLNVNIDYYLNKGLNLDEAKIALKERQSTFSLEKCIIKYGDIEGKIKQQQRQDKQIQTILNKSQEEIILINKKKLSSGTYSKMSQKLFQVLYENFKNNNIVFYELKNKEITLFDYDNNKLYKYDYVDLTNKKIIEFNGDFQHCNPKLYNENFLHRTIKKTAKEIQEKDKIKNEFIKNKGYDLLIVQENDFKHHKEKVIQDCIEFINKK